MIISQEIPDEKVLSDVLYSFLRSASSVMLRLTGDGISPHLVDANALREFNREYAKIRGSFRGGFRGFFFALLRKIGIMFLMKC